MLPRGKVAEGYRGLPWILQQLVILQLFQNEVKKKNKKTTPTNNPLGALKNQPTNQHDTAAPYRKVRTKETKSLGWVWS